LVLRSLPVLVFVDRVRPSHGVLLSIIRDGGPYGGWCSLTMSTGSLTALSFGYHLKYLTVLVLHGPNQHIYIVRPDKNSFFFYTHF
jgi:hypothetical protein